MYKLSKITDPQPSDRRDQCDDAGLTDYQSNDLVATQNDSTQQTPPEKPRGHKRDHHSPKHNHRRRRDEKHTSHRKRGHHHHHHRVTAEKVTKTEENKHSTVGNSGFPPQSETLVTSEAFLMQQQMQEEETKAWAKENAKHEQHKETTHLSRGADGIEGGIVHHSPEEEFRNTYDHLSPTSSTRPGAFREGGSDGCSVISEADEDQSLHGDIEQGIVPSSFEEPTIEAHVVDEALEQERYDQLYGDLENMRKALSTADKQPIIVPATRLMSCKERSLSMLYGGRLLFLIGGCIVLVVVISSMIKNVKAPPDLLPYLLWYLEFISPDGGAALSDLNSPQFRAATWLAGNQNLFLMGKRSLIQRYALATLYYSTGGDQWFTNYKWLTDSNECEWYNTKWSEGWESDSSGIRTFCSNEDDGDLEMIFLQGNNLHGQVPLELSLLSNSLVRVDLREGYLSGTFPEALLRLSSLEWLELTLNPLLTGPLPTELGQLPALKFLAVGRLGGEKGGLPSELGLLTRLETLGLEGNDHTGKIPSELSLLTALKELYLERNSFTGTVPSLRLPYLEKLHLNENLLTGTIPTELGLLRALEEVALQNNSLTSTIPEALGLLTNLKDLYLDSNKLTSTIPSAVVSLSHLEHLFLHKQMLNGTIPTEFGLATSLTEVALFDNMLSGTVPTELSGLPLLEKLKLHKNSLTGAIELDGDTCPPPPLVVLTADCNEVACCCTQCCNILFDKECI